MAVLLHRGPAGQRLPAGQLYLPARSTPTRPGLDYQSAVLDSGPHSYWRLDEASGTTAASSRAGQRGHRQRGVLGGDARRSPGRWPAPSATSASFNGSSSYVSLPNNDLAFGATYQSVSCGSRPAPRTGCCSASQAGPISAGTVNCQLRAEPVHRQRRQAGRRVLAGRRARCRRPRAVTDGKWHLVTMTAAGQHPDAVPGRSAGRRRVRPGWRTPTENTTTWAPGSSAAAGPTSRHQDQTGTAYATYFNGPHLRRGVLGPAADVSRSAAPCTRPGPPAASLLTKVTRPTGSVYSQVAYNPVTGAVTSVTDDQRRHLAAGRAGGAPGPARCTCPRCWAPHPADYCRLADIGHQPGGEPGQLGGDRLLQQRHTGRGAGRSPTHRRLVQRVELLPVAAVRRSGTRPSPASVGLWFKIHRQYPRRRAVRRGGDGPRLNAGPTTSRPCTWAPTAS